jgi:hypothetical protein
VRLDEIVERHHLRDGGSENNRAKPRRRVVAGLEEAAPCGEQRFAARAVEIRAPSGAIDSRNVSPARSTMNSRVDPTCA